MGADFTVFEVMAEVRVRSLTGSLNGFNPSPTTER
jgi:hypothetical protein